MSIFSSIMIYYTVLFSSAMRKIWGRVEMILAPSFSFCLLQQLWLPPDHKTILLHAVGISIKNIPHSLKRDLAFTCWEKKAFFCYLHYVCYRNVFHANLKKLSHGLCRLKSLASIFQIRCLHICVNLLHPYPSLFLYGQSLSLWWFVSS